MKRFVLFSLILIAACAGNERKYPAAENALDAGREYINACLQGDFAKAGSFMVNSKKNVQQLDEAEKAYREKDKEGRQQLRGASINISEIKEVNDSVTIIYYNNSFDKLPQSLSIIKQSNNWLADPSHINHPNTKL